MIVGIKWRYVRGNDDPAWDWAHVLYAYLDPSGKEILYIGKAVRTTVRQRWNRSAKEGFWDDLETERGIDRHIVVVGDFRLEPGKNLSPLLIADVESLLIKRIKPWGNIQSIKNRISRPKMRVICKGACFGDRREYRDV